MSQSRGVAHRTMIGMTDPLLAIGRNDERDDDQRFAVQVSMRSHGRLASATERGQHGTFGGDPGPCLGMLQALGDLKRGIAIVARLHRQRALAHGWTHHAGIEEFRDSIFQSQTPQSGRGENDGIVAAFIQFAQPGIDVAANVFDLQIGPASSKLRGAAQRTSSYASARGQILEGAAYQSIAWIFALRDGGQRQALRQIGGHVFQAMYGQIDRASEQRFLNFLGEQSF